MTLEELKNNTLICNKCSIGCQKINGFNSNVFSNMSSSKIMVIGQNPGENETKQGLPFVGISGKFFDDAIKEVLGIDRSKFYITNTIKCFTPKNRAPTDEEITNCQLILEKEIEIIKPQLIVTLGNPALKQITGMTGITRLHGSIIYSNRYKVPVLPFYHPSPLNTNRPEIRKAFKEDLLKLKDFLE